MARIYDRDNIQYAPMIQQAIANSRAAGEKRAQYQKNKYDIANQLVQAGGRTLQSYASDDPDNEGWTSYIMTGDRSALEAARNRAQQQAMQEAQFAQQQQMQEDQQKHALALQEKQIASTEKIAAMNKSTQQAYDLYEAEKNLTQWKLRKADEAAKGHDTRYIDAEINKIESKFPSLKSNELQGEAADPRGTVEYKINRYKNRDAGNSTSAELDGMIEEIEQFNTPESAAQLSRLEEEKEKRVRMEQSKAAIEADIKRYQQTGQVSDYLLSLGYYSQSAGSERSQLYGPNGKPVYGKTAKKKNGTPNDPID